MTDKELALREAKAQGWKKVAYLGELNEGSVFETRIPTEEEGFSGLPAVLYVKDGKVKWLSADERDRLLSHLQRGLGQ